MSVVGSCGHTFGEWDGDGYQAAVKSYCSDGERAVAHVVVCMGCWHDYNEACELLETPEEEDVYLRGEI
jgi:hypothetical protein